MEKYGRQRHGMLDTPIPSQQMSQAGLQRSHSWSGSGSSSKGSSNSTKRDFFSASHTKRALVAINDGGSDDDLDAEVPADASASHPEGQSQLPESVVHRHEVRRCIPCIELQVVKHCRKGRDCRFCHLPHDDSMVKEQRPTKEMRDRCKNSISKCIEQNKDNKQLMVEDLQKLVARQSPFLRHYTVKMLRDIKVFEIEDSSSFGIVSLPTNGGKQGGKGGSGGGGDDLLQKGGKCTGYPHGGKGPLGKISL